jgi:hypothetical protein
MNRTLTSKKYKVYSGTIVTGSTNTSLGLNAMFNSGVFINKTTGKTLNVKLNKNTNDNIPIDTVYTSPLTIDDMDITDVYLSNSSGDTITYLIILKGL